MRQQLLIIGVLLLFTLLSNIVVPFASAKDQGEFISINTAQLSFNDSNIQQVKQAAVSEALSAALQGAIAKILPGHVLALNLDFLYRNILNKPMDYILTYRVIRTFMNEGKLMLAVEATVNMELLKKTLAGAKIISSEKENPVILLFIYEKTPLNESPVYWWGGNPDFYKSEAEKIISDKMLQKQFVLIGNKVQRPDPSFYNIVFSSFNDVNAAISLGKKVKADIIIMGTAISAETANRMGEEKGFTAKIDLIAYDVETGQRVFVSDIESAIISYTDEQGYALALENAANQSADDLIVKLNAYWDKYLRKQQSFKLRLSGDLFLPRFLAFKRSLDQIQDVEDVLHKEAGTNSVLLEIRYKGRIDQFANELMLKTFDTFGIDIVEVTDNMIDIRMVDKGLESSSPVIRHMLPSQRNMLLNK